MMNTTPPPTSKGERSRIIIIDTAFELFINQGYAATSMRQISEKSGIALGGIYNHFSSKEDIFVNVLVTHHPYYSIIPIVLSAPGDTYPDFCRNAVAEVIQMLGPRPRVLVLLLVEIIEFNGKHIPLIFQDLYPKALQIGRRIAAFEGMRPFPTPILIRNFLATFASYYLSELILSGMPVDEIKENAFEYMMDIHLHGIMKTDHSDPQRPENGDSNE